MQAANPGCLLEDFVRWYSPRDWIEDNEPVHTEPNEATPTMDDQQTTGIANEEEIKMETEDEGCIDIHDIPDSMTDVIASSQATQCEEVEKQPEVAQVTGTECSTGSNTASPLQTNRMLQAVNSGSQDDGDADSAPGDGWEDEDWDVIESDMEGEEVKNGESEEKLPKRVTICI